MAIAAKVSSVKKVRRNTSAKKTVKKSSSKKNVIKSFRRDPKQTASLIKVGKSSAAKAIRESKALGLSITFIENGILYKEQADGSREIVKNKEKRERSSNSLVIKKGMIFHAKK
ncbi:MAG: hypothetical protein Q8M29_17960 [Bacteroidota bacterium]|nr:hypothetical protein [Bacteroidota bacterium]